MRRLVPARAPLVALAVAAAVIPACGDDATPDAGPAETTSSALAPTTTPPEEPATTSTTTTTTAPLPPPVEALDPADLPDLVVRWAENTDPALDLARAVVGFPLEIPPPTDAGAYEVRVDVDAREPDGPWRWEWTYVAVAAEPIGDVDIALDDSGPGAVALREYGDRVMGGLGWSYSNSTGSDPSSGGGGPQSINHVYTSDAPVPVGSIEAVARPAFLWADEDVDFRDGPDVGGYRVDVGLDLPSGAPAVPLLELLLDTVPTPVGGRLVDASLRSLDRTADSFEADEGLRYLEAELVYLIPPAEAEAARASYAEELDGVVLRAAEESFFEPGFYEPARPLEGDSWRQNVLLVERYEGSIVIEERSGETQVRVRVPLEPNRERLRPLES